MHPTTAPITAVILAGGQGTRMGGLDKGLQLLHGQPLVQHALQRLRAQKGGLIGHIMVSANRHLAAYAALGVPVWPDHDQAGHGMAANTVFEGPLAGFACGLRHCPSDWLLTVPCDTPLFPLDLAERLWQAAQLAHADMAMAYAPEPSDPGHSALEPQPVFCLLHARLAASLAQYLHSGGRKIRAWVAQQPCAQVVFDQAQDKPHAFSNANTLDALHALQQNYSELSNK
jgi:molybdenum cofactor guanylyltransferase